MNLELVIYFLYDYCSIKNYFSIELVLKNITAMQYYLL